MAAQRKLEVVILGDAKGARKAFKAAGTAAGKFGSKMGSIAKVGAKAGIAIGVGVAVGVAKLGLSLDKANKDIAVATGATGEKLKGLTDSFKDTMSQVPDSMGSVSAAIGTLNTLTGATGDGLEAMAVQVLDASRMLGEDAAGNADLFGKAMKQWQIDSADGPELLDSLFKATQDYGVSMGGLLGNMNKFGPVMQNAGFSVGETADLMGRLESAGIQVTRIMPGMNAAFRNMAAAGKDPREELGLIFNAMKDATTEAEALNLATEAFGAEGAQRMTTAVRNGVLSLEDLGDALEGQEGLVQDTNARTESLGDRWAEFSNKLKMKVAPIAMAAMEAMMKATAFLQPHIENLAAIIQSKVIPAVTKFGKEMVARLTPAFKAVADFVVNKILPALERFSGWMKKNPEVIKAVAIAIGVVLVGAFVAWAASAAAATVATALAAAPFVALIAAVAGLVYAYRNVDGFRNVVDAMADGVKVAIGFVVDNFHHIVTAVQTVLDKIKPIVKEIMTIFDPIIDYYKNLFKAVKALFTGDWTAALTAGKDALVAALSVWKKLFAEWPAKIAVELAKAGLELVKWIAPALPGLLLELGKLWAKVQVWAVETAAKLATEMAKMALELVKWIVDAVPDVIAELGIMAAKIGEWIVEEFGKAISAWAQAAFAMLKVGAALAWDAIKFWFVGIPQLILGVIPALGETLSDLGGALLDGLKAGAVAAWELAKSWFEGVGNLVSGALGTVASLSSKLAAKGAALGQGFVDGIKGAIRGVVGWVIDQINALIGAYNRIPFVPDLPKIGGPSKAGGGLTKGGGGAASSLQFAHGGPIPGLRHQPVPIVAHGGEHMLSAADVDAAKKAKPTLGLGRRPGLNTGFDGGPVVNINITLTSTATHADGQRIAQAIRDEVRRNPASFPFALSA